MACIEKTSATYTGGNIPAATYLKPTTIILSDADIKAILDYLDTVYGYAGTLGKGSVTIGFDQTNNTWYFTSSF